MSAPVFIVGLDKVIEHGSVRELEDALAIVQVDDLKKAALNSSPVVLKAVQGRRVDMIRALVSRGADINARDERGWTALLAAVSGRYVEEVKVLLELGADVQLASHKGMSPLLMSIYGDDSSLVELLLDKGHARHVLSLPNNDPRYSPVFVCCEHMKPQHLFLLHKHFSPEEFALGAAAVSWDAKYGAVSPLLMAINSASAHQEVPVEQVEKMVELLVGVGGASPGKAEWPSAPYGLTPLYLVCSWTNKTSLLSVLRILLQHKADPNQVSNVPPSVGGLSSYPVIACAHLPEALTLLVEQGKARIDVADDNGLTPLGKAVLANSEESVRLLLTKYGANAAVVDNDGSSLLVMCAFFVVQKNQNRRAVISLLLEHGANPLEPTRGIMGKLYAGMSALQIAQSGTSEEAQFVAKMLKK